MPLLADYAITPDVFDVASYSTSGECEARLDSVRRVMLTEGFVRDLRVGEWRGVFDPDVRQWHRRGLELVKELAKQGRLVPCPPALPEPPLDDRGWCAEALATHERRPLIGGVIVTGSVKDCFWNAETVARVDRLPGAKWWAERSPSVRLTRTLAEYEAHLDPILRCSNSVMFIDPHLDPGKRRYDGFGTLLQRAGLRTPAPRIEIHRVCYEGPRRDRCFPDFAPIFRGALTESLRLAGLTATVHIWDDFHDRYVISNLIGISLPNGFDTSRAPGAVTTWTRLGRRDRDDVQREFDPAAGRHVLRARFEVP